MAGWGGAWPGGHGGHGCLPLCAASASPVFDRSALCDPHFTIDTGYGCCRSSNAAPNTKSHPKNSRKNKQKAANNDPQIPCRNKIVENRREIFKLCKISRVSYLQPWKHRHLLMTTGYLDYTTITTAAVTTIRILRLNKRKCAATHMVVPRAAKLGDSSLKIHDVCFLWGKRTPWQPAQPMGPMSPPSRWCWPKRCWLNRWRWRWRWRVPLAINQLQLHKPHRVDGDGDVAVDVDGDCDCDCGCCCCDANLQWVMAQAKPKAEAKRVERTIWLLDTL